MVPAQRRRTWTRDRVRRSCDIGVSDAQTFNTIKNGVVGTPMAPQRLPESDIWKIVTYIHALRGPAIDSRSWRRRARRGGCSGAKGNAVTATCYLAGATDRTRPVEHSGIRKSSSIVDALTKEQHRIYGSGGAHLRALPPWTPIYQCTSQRPMGRRSMACS